MAIFMTYRSEVLADNPTTYYEFNETSGNFVATSGTVTGTALGTITYAQPAIGGFKSIFVTGGGRFTLAYPDIFPNSAWTIEMWAKTPSVTPNNYGTLWRRDGNGKAVFGRTADETLNDKIVFYDSGAKKISTNGYNDDTWHHIVWTITAGTMKLYIDGVEQTTAGGSGLIGSTGTANALCFGAGGPTDGSEPYKGYIAQVAIYDNVSLSPTRITAHYNAGIAAINTSYPATPMLATAAIPTNNTFVATPMTASAAMPDVKAGPTKKVTVVLGDAGAWTNGAWDAANYGTLDGTNRKLHWTIDLTNVSLNTLASATLNVSLSRGSANSDSLVADFSALTNASGQAWTATTIANTKTLSWSFASGYYGVQQQSVDAIDAVRTALAANNGLVFNPTSYYTPAGNGAFSVNSKSIDIYVYTANAAAATPMTASTGMPTPTVTTGTGVIVTTVPSTADALEVEPTVATQKYNTYAAEVMLADAFIPEVLTADRRVWATVATAYADMPTPIVVAGQSHSISTVPATADALFVDGVFSNNLSLSILVPTMGASAKLVPFKEAADPLRERYNALIASQTDTDDNWFRFAETGATNIAIDEIGKRPGSNGNTGRYYGDPQLGQVGAPGNMPYVTFDGVNDWMNTGGYSDNTYTGSIEMVFRTTKKNQALFYGFGDTAGPQSLIYDEIFELRDGRVSMRRENVGYWGNTDWTDLGHGFQDVADGQWHHLVITNWWQHMSQDDYSERGGSSISFYIDGKLDKRIQGLNPGDKLAAVQAIGKPIDASVGYFQGDISTFVNRKAWSIPKYWIEQNSYAALDHSVIRTGQMTANAETPNARGKGNSLRVLSLHFRFVSNINNNTQYSAGVLYETRYALSDPNDMGGYRDPVTSEQYYMDLMNPQHIDIASYDLIELYDIPTHQYTRSYFSISDQRAEKAIDDFYTGLKRAVVEKGVNLWIKDPEIAKRLGFIDQFRTRFPNRETKGFEFDAYRPFAGQMGAGLVNEYDYWGWKNNPWAATHDSFSTQFENPYWYPDTHTDWGQRVVALEDGLTNLPGATLAETLQVNYPDPWHRGGNDWAHRWDDNLSGLRIGQEILPWAQNWSGPDVPSLDTYLPGRAIVSVPDEFVKVGHVICREIANDWVDEGRPPNPNANNATVIIIKPGDLIDGVPTKGKVFMGFLGDSWAEESWTEYGIPNPNEPPEMKRWQTSSYRAGGSYTAVNIDTGQVVGVTPVETAPLPSSQPTPGEVGKVPSRPTPAQSLAFAIFQPAEIARQYVPNGSMGRRGRMWITSDIAVAQPGDVIIKSPILAAAGTTPAPTTGAQKNASVRVDPMLANAELKNRANATQREAQVLVFPMLATAKMTEKAVNIKAEPMLGNAEMRTNFNDVFATGKQIDLVFDRSRKTIVVYLRREN